MKVTIKDYAEMPEVLIDGRVFVDGEMFKHYILNLLNQEHRESYSHYEKAGLEVAMSIIRNIR